MYNPIMKSCSFVDSESGDSADEFLMDSKSEEEFDSAGDRLIHAACKLEGYLRYNC